MILLKGSDAYSPFRMDALKEAIAKLDPELGPISLDAKWVYAIQTNGESFDPEELKRAATLLNAAAAICAGGKADTLADAVAQARASLDTGAALAKLEALVAFRA